MLLDKFRRQQIPEKRTPEIPEVCDPFGLEEPNTHAELVPTTTAYDEAITLAEALLPELDRQARRAWKRGEEVTLPPRALEGDERLYQMTVRHDKRTNSGTVGFMRADEDPTAVGTRGFTLHRHDNGITLVHRDEVGYGTVDLQSREYPLLLTQAEKWINKYAGSFEIEKKPFARPDNLTETDPSNTEEDTQGEVIVVQVAAGIGLMAVAGYVGLNIIFGSLFGSNSSEPSEWEQERLRAQQEYEAFEAAYPRLPDDVPIITTGETTRLYVDPELDPEIIEHARERDAWEATDGKITKLDTYNLETLGHLEPSGQSGSCFSSEFGNPVPKNAELQAVAITESLKDKLDITFDRTGFSICNATERALAGLGLDDIYIDYHAPSDPENK